MKKVRNGFIKNLRYFCLLVVIVFGLITIVGTNGGGDEDEDGDGNGDSGSSLTITGESGNQVELNGSWSEGCEADEDEGDSEKFVNTISGSSFSMAGNMWFNSTECSGTFDFTMSETGTFTLGGEVTATLSGSSVTATKVDVVVSTAQFTINNEDMVSDFNSGEGFCGYTDWAVGVPKDVLGTDCAPESFKDIIYIDDTADPDLWYSGIGSDEGGPLDANDYPTTIDPDSAEARM
jgi:hypothetical protein